MIGLGNEEKKLMMTQFLKGGNMLMGKDNNKKMDNRGRMTRQWMTDDDGFNTEDGLWR